MIDDSLAYTVKAFGCFLPENTCQEQLAVVSLYLCMWVQVILKCNKEIN